MAERGNIEALLGDARQRLTQSDLSGALKSLEWARDAAMKHKSVDELRAVQVVAWEAGSLASGRKEGKAAERLVYAVKQNLAFHEYAAGVRAPGVAPPPGTAQHSSHARHMEVRGHNGTVRLDDDFVTISRKGFLARASVGKGDKRILISQITAVQFKPAGPVVNGFIQFTVGGGIERQSRFGSQTTNRVRDENSVVFWYAQRREFGALRDAVELAMADSHRQQPAVAPTSAPQSIPEQIKELAALRAAGILTVWALPGSTETVLIGSLLI